MKKVVSGSNHELWEDLLKQMDKKPMHLTSAVANHDVKQLSRELVEKNIEKFAFLFQSGRTLKTRKIDRVYSKQEIRRIVEDNLIPDFQQSMIIDALTDYLYGLHID